MSHTLRSVELYLVRLPLVRPFTTSSHTKHHLDHILIRVRDQDGAEGWPGPGTRCAAIALPRLAWKWRAGICSRVCAVNR